jgi:hypothetical protein
MVAVLSTERAKLRERSWSSIQLSVSGYVNPCAHSARYYGSFVITTENGWQRISVWPQS